VVTCAFGDLFLRDTRAYRDRQLSAHGMRGVYPLWGRDTALLIRDFLAQGFKTAVVCVDPAKRPPQFVDESSTQIFWPSCPQALIPAARMASSTPSCLTGLRAETGHSGEAIKCRLTGAGAGRPSPDESGGEVFDQCALGGAVP
jgi:Diphthamide synthase